MMRLLIVLIFFFLLASVLAFAVFEDRIASYFWQRHGNAYVALLLNDSDAQLFVELGHYYFGGQRSLGLSLSDRVYDLNRAKFAYAKAVEIDPQLPGVHYNLARVLLVEGDIEGALSEINQEIMIHPENLRSLYIRGLLYGFRNASGDLERAEKDFRSFTDWASTEWAGYNDLMWVLLKQAKYAEAEEVGDKAIAGAIDGAENPWLWNSLGVAQLNQKKYSEAETSFTQALKFANSLTEEDWRRAYSGNNPASIGSGLESFRKGIEENLKKVI